MLAVVSFKCSQTYPLSISSVLMLMHSPTLSLLWHGRQGLVWLGRICSIVLALAAMLAVILLGLFTKFVTARAAKVVMHAKLVSFIISVCAIGTYVTLAQYISGELIWEKPIDVIS